ncbi:hypothetical protein [Paenibacillus sp. W2I17]|uniref:hypothetical protein n=1 Tax=Paenibacillus sp. W2I17 TaxID=3042311 RepID=UPI0027833F1F|nr:hypothetical protein [Paenibacillus sp. W2I17]MDQ0660995.1 hypothetical protein [Paenibacillus sp. W2I17]
MYFRHISIVLGLVFLIITGCNNEGAKLGADEFKITGDEKTATEYVKAKGYKISLYDGHVQKYTLDKEKLLYGIAEMMPYRQTWGVQKVEPEKYFGMEISVYSFTVTNHPLEELYDTKTKVSILLCEGKVIGGTSFPDAAMDGAPYSLDGKTLEEVTGKSFHKWSEEWKKKYGT